MKELMITELLAQHAARPGTKDILIVVHDQPKTTEACLDSVLRHTPDATVWVWDNGSAGPTQDLLARYAAEHANVKVVRCEENAGFIVPNNLLASYGTGEYLILLNNDTEVSAGWSEALLGYLQQHPVAAVGYEGGLLNEYGIGVGPHTGDEIDYLMGWCVCLRRETYDKYGLFDGENLNFAYGEDSDFSLRLKEAGERIYSLNLALVKHHAHQTTLAVKKEKNLKPEFIGNHRHIEQRWGGYLAEHRVLLKYPDIEGQIVAKWKKDHGQELTVDSLVEACL
jgi:GT2 family glycosyltransferase